MCREDITCSLCATADCRAPLCGEGEPLPRSRPARPGERELSRPGAGELNMGAPSLWPERAPLRWTEPGGERRDSSRLGLQRGDAPHKSV